VIGTSFLKIMFLLTPSLKHQKMSVAKNIEKKGRSFQGA